LALRGGNETRVLSRNEKDLGIKFPAVKDSIAALDIRDAIIDGEIVALDEKGRSSVHPFRHCKDSTWVRRGLQSFSTLLICSSSTARIFAIPIEERKAKLEEVLKKPPGVIRYSASFTKDIRRAFGQSSGIGT
jgi:bifunctional non-homologous end joining protein LigD